MRKHEWTPADISESEPPLEPLADAAENHTNVTLTKTGKAEGSSIIVSVFVSLYIYIEEQLYQVTEEEDQG